MKIKSTLIPLAIAVFGFALTAPVASAMPPSKEPAWKHFRGKGKEEIKTVTERRTEEGAQRTHRRILSYSNFGRAPYFQRKRGF